MSMLNYFAAWVPNLVLFESLLRSIFVANILGILETTCLSKLSTPSSIGYVGACERGAFASARLGLC